MFGEGLFSSCEHFAKKLMSGAFCGLGATNRLFTLVVGSLIEVGSVIAIGSLPEVRSIHVERSMNSIGSMGPEGSTSC